MRQILLFVLHLTYFPILKKWRRWQKKKNWLKMNGDKLRYQIQERVHTIASCWRLSLPCSKGWTEYMLIDGWLDCWRTTNHGRITLIKLFWRFASIKLWGQKRREGGSCCCATMLYRTIPYHKIGALIGNLKTTRKNFEYLCSGCHCYSDEIVLLPVKDMNDRVIR